MLPIVQKNANEMENSLDAGIQDSSMSISIMYEIEEMSHEKNGEESDKRI